jgi:acyl carrier protein
MSSSDVTVVRKLIMGIIDPEREIGIDDYLPDLGLDSVRTVELFIATEDALGIKFPDEALSMDNFQSLSTIIRLIDSVR